MSEELPIEQSGEIVNNQSIDQEHQRDKESFPEGLAKSGAIIFGIFGTMQIATAIESENDKDYFEKNIEQTPEVVEIQDNEHQLYVHDSIFGVSLLGLSLLSCAALVRIRRKNCDKK